MRKMYRHGDVLLIKIDKLPYKMLKKKEGNIILEGEVTGHAHRLKGNARLWEVAEAISNNTEGIIGYAEVEKGTSIIHEEHKEIQLPKGYYEIRRQREYDENYIRFVQD